jgi:hypothetical protein
METTERIDGLRLERVVDIKRRVEAELLARPGVHGVGVGTKYAGGEPTDTIAIRVHVAEKRDVPDAERIPAAIEGVPTDVIGGRLSTLAGAGVDAPGADGGRYDPLVGGISSARCGDPPFYTMRGTLGCIVVDLGDTNSAERGMPMLLGAAQAMAAPDSTNELQTQPSSSDFCHHGWPCDCDAQRVGRVSRKYLGDLPNGGPGIDAAVAHQTDRGFDWTIQDLGRVGGIAQAVWNKPVRKRGRTTGVSYGWIDGVDTTYVVDYPNGQVTLSHQITIRTDPSRSQHFAEAGDAGALAVYDDMAVVGMLWGANNDVTPALAMACPIGAVTTALKVQVPYSAPDVWIRDPHPPTGIGPSTQAPTMAVMSDNQLAVAWTETDGRISIATSADGVHFDHSRTYDDMRSHNGPWLARGVNETYVAFTDQDGEVCLTWFRDWVSSDDHVVDRLGEHSPLGPAMVGAGEAGPGVDALVLTWTASDGVIWARYGTRGGSLTTNRKALPAKSPNGPCMTSIAGPASYTVGVGFRGDDSEMYFRYSSDPASLQFPTEVHIRNERTVSRPSAMPLPPSRYAGPEWIAWRGTDSHNYLNLQRFDGAPLRKVVYPYETKAAASLAMWNGQLWIAWLSNENSRIFVGPVR